MVWLFAELLNCRNKRQSGCSLCVHFQIIDSKYNIENGPECQSNIRNYSNCYFGTDMLRSAIVDWYQIVYE